MGRSFHVWVFKERVQKASHVEGLIDSTVCENLASDGGLWGRR